MALTKRLLSTSKLLVLAGALLITFFLSATGAMRLALRTREVEVPSLSGKSTEEASQLLSQLGLSLRIDENRRLDPNVPINLIAQQDPQSGITTRRRRGVRVWLSAGARTSIVPTLIGQTESMAQARLTQEEFALQSISSFRSPDYQTDTVVAQIPPPTSNGSAVSILVNRGERARSFVMPDLIGFNSSSVSEILRTRGFRVTIVGERSYPGLPAGIVVRQQPPAGFQVVPGNPFSLEISR